MSVSSDAGRPEAVARTIGDAAAGSDDAIGVVIGAPVLTLAAARLNRRTLLLLLVVVFVAGNILSAIAAPTAPAVSRAGAARLG